MNDPDGPGLWRLVSCAVPASLRGQVPLFQVIKHYCLEIGKEVVHVERTFASCQEGTRLQYRGPVVNETVYISQGRISSVDSHYHPSKGIPTKDDDPETFREKLQDIFTPPKTETPQYHNLKRFASHLELLGEQNSEWRHDLDAIVQGTGEFKEEE